MKHGNKETKTNNTNNNGEIDKNLTNNSTNTNNDKAPLVIAQI